MTQLLLFPFFFVICPIVDGKAVEEWEVADGLNSLKQLGVVEYTEKGTRCIG